MRISLAITLAALVAAPTALAGGGPQYAAVGGPGVAASNGKLHYVAISPTSGRTTLVTVGGDGSVWNWPSFRGSFGVPTIGYQTPVGLSRDGRRLFLQSLSVGAPTQFLVVDTRSMRAVDRFTLHGAFSFDALSPDGSTLYLTDRVDPSNTSRYVVRAYDLATHTLLPGKIADRTQKRWVMEGEAISRAVSPGGRWIYTLYSNPGGTPFIHALDTVRGVAHCTGIPWASADQGALWNVVLTPHGSRLAVHWRSGKSWFELDRTTWRLSPVGGSGFPWSWLGLGLGFLFGLAALPALLRTLRRGRSAEGTRLATQA
jgi:hypothetical protein